MLNLTEYFNNVALCRQTIANAAKLVLYTHSSMLQFRVLHAIRV